METHQLQNVYEENNETIQTQQRQTHTYTATFKKVNFEIKNKTFSF